MGDPGAFPFPGSLDPRAQEFVPLNRIHDQTRIFFPSPTQVYFAYAPPPQPVHPPVYQQSHGQVPSFYNYPPSQVQQALRCAPTSDRRCFGVAVSPELPPPSSVPTRALSLSSVPCDVSESTVRRDLEVFGDVRGVQMERVLEGIVTVHFYDLRDAEMALREISDLHMQQQARLSAHFMGSTFLNSMGELSPHVLPSPARGLISGRAVWAQFVVPTTSAVPGGCNQGTVVVFNLDPAVSSTTLKEIFEAYGPIKELRETPFKKHQRFVEFFDVRDASKALKEMNGQEINGKQAVIEFSRPGGYKNKCLRGIQHLSVHSPPLPPSHQPSRPPQSFSGWLKKKPPKNGNPNGGVESFMRSISIIGAKEAKVEINGGQKSQRKSRSGSSNSSKSWKNRHMKMDNTRFLISEEAMEVSSCGDLRTTLMIKNIPNKYSQTLLLNMLDNHCIHCNEQIDAQGDESQPLSSYDFVYLPIDFNNKCNVGYGFVNMTSPQAAWRLYKAFHLQRWEVFNSRKICEVTYARLQGLEAMKEHFKNTKFPRETDHCYLPVVFSPPRDGIQLTESVPIGINGLKIDDSPDDHDQTEDPDHSACGPCHLADHEELLPSSGGSISSSVEGGGGSTADSDNIHC